VRWIWNRWLAGGIAFALPAFVTVAGLRLDRSPLAHDPVYASLIRPAVWIAVMLAVVVPGALILTSPLPLTRRIALVAAAWCLLALECAVALYVGLMSALH